MKGECAMKRLILTTAFAALGAALLTAQAAQKHDMHDPDKMVEGGGKLPAGWQARLDNPAAKLEAVKFEPAGAGFHVTSGPAGIYYKTDQKASGTYEAHATFTQVEPSAHPDGRWVTRTRVHDAEPAFSGMPEPREPAVVPVAYEAPTECLCVEGDCDVDHAND